MKQPDQYNRESVTQEDSLGCAVASLSFVLNITYQEGVVLFEDGQRRVREKANFYCPEIVDILANKGLRYSWAEINNQNMELIEKDFAIIFCTQSEKLPFGHFLVRYNGKWMDPWINLPFPRRASGFRDELPGIPTYVVFPIE